MIPTAYSRNQRYQLDKLAEQHGLTLSDFEAQRQAILGGAEPFGKPPRFFISNQLPLHRTFIPRDDQEDMVLDVLAERGECLITDLAKSVPFSRSHLATLVLPSMLARGLIKRRKIASDKTGRNPYLWSLS